MNCKLEDNVLGSLPIETFLYMHCVIVYEGHVLGHQYRSIWQKLHLLLDAFNLLLHLTSVTSSECSVL